MFKKFREKVAEEIQHIQAKVNIQDIQEQARQSYRDNIVSLSNSSQQRHQQQQQQQESDMGSSSNESNLMQFSLVDLDDNEESSTITTSTQSNFVPQSDIESEYESESNSHAIHSSLDKVTKEQLLDLCIKLKERGRKYRDRWTQVINAYRALNEERDNMKKVLEESQDKALRRINELKEQCNLEQLAKRHLEENLQIVIEEKDEKIKVLQTKIGLLNQNQLNSDSNDLLHFSSEQHIDKADGTTNLQEKVERLELLLTRCKESVKTNKHKVNSLNKENEQLVNYKSKYDELCEQMQSFENERHSTNLSYAEAKQQLHNELESKNIIITELKEQIEHFKHKVRTLESDFETKTKALYDCEQKIIEIEKTSEEDKENLLQELSRGKSAAIHLIRDESDKKLLTSQQEWSNKYDDLVKQNYELSKTCKQINETRTQNENLKLEINECRSQLNTVEHQLNQVEQSRLTEKTHLEQLLSDSEHKSNKLLFEIESLKQNCTNLDNLKLELENTTHLLVNAQTKTDDARNELESLRLQLQEKDIILTQFSEDVVNNQQMKNNLISLETDLNECNLKINVLECDLKIRSEECINHLQQLNLIENEKNELINQLSCSQSNFDDVSRANDLLKSELNQIKNQLSETINDFSIYKKSNEEKCDKLNEWLELEKCENERLTNEIKNLKDDSICLDSLKNQLNDTESSLKNVEHDYLQSLSQIETIKKQLDVSNSNFDKLKLDFSVNENTFKAELNDMQIKFDSERKLTESLKLQFETVSNEKNELIKQLNDMINENELLKSQTIELSFKEKECIRLRDSFDDQCNKVEQLIQQIQALNHKYSDYDSLKNRIEDNEQLFKISDSKYEECIKEKLFFSKQLEEKNILMNKLKEESNIIEENLKSKIKELEKQFDDRLLRSSDLENQLKTLSENNDFNAKRADKLLNDKTECDNIIAELSSDNEKLLEITNEFEQKVLTLQTDLNHQKNHYEDIIAATKREENLRLRQVLNLPAISEIESNSKVSLLGVHLPEPTEYEYLRNILFEFMMGREPVTLAKVISAVMRFSSDQTEQIIKKQETYGNSM